MSRRRREPLNREAPPPPIRDRMPLAWTCQVCRLSLWSRESSPRCPRCSGTLLPPPEAPRTFRADLCDECYAPLPKGHRLAGLCPKCLEALELTPQRTPEST